MRKFILLTAILLLSVITIFGTVHSTVRAENESSTQTSNIVVERSRNSSIANGIKERVESSWPWYLARASGLVAAVVLVILMLSGVGLVTGHTFSFLEPITAWASHRALGIAFMISVLFHLTGIYFDTFVPFSLMSLFIPFVSTFKPVTLGGHSFGSLFIADGIFALYLVIAIVLTSLLWVEKKPYVWKITHLLSYLAMLFVFIHGLFIGTDLAHGLLRWMWVTAAVAVLLASMSRLWRAQTV